MKIGATSNEKKTYATDLHYLSELDVSFHIFPKLKMI